MKWISYILLLVLAFTVFAPMTLFTLTIVNDEGSFFGNIDVCHAATPALSSNGEMPCVGLTPCSAAPTLSILFSEPLQPVYTELILAGRNEHPPRS